MASQADSNRAIARLEMERLHKGMVVELERRLAPVNVDGIEAEVQGAEHDEDPEVAEAISLLQQTVEAIRDLKLEVEERDQTIRSRDATVAQLESEKAQLQQERASLESQLDVSRNRIQDADATIARQDGQIRQIVDAIRSSFAPNSEQPQPLRVELG